MRRLFAIVVILVSSSVFAADKPPASTKPGSKSGGDKAAAQHAGGVADAQPTPPPGECVYAQAGVKICSAPADGTGAFDVYTAVPAVVFIRTEEPIIHYIPPTPTYYQSAARDNTVTIIPTQAHLPESAPAIIQTKTLSITLNLRPGSKQKVDTQLLILDPQRNERSVAITRAMADAEKQLRPKIAAELHEAELEALAKDGAELGRPKGKTIDRNDELIVLRAQQILRVGARRFLLFTVQNRSAEPFTVKTVRVWLGGQAAPQAGWKLAKTTVPTAEEAHGVVELPSLARGQLRLRIEEFDVRRSVELDGIQVP